MTDDFDERPRKKYPNQDRRARKSAVGYGRPPRQHRFQAGQSGNPKGRPRGRKNESTLLREILGRKINYRTGDRTRKISVLEGILLRIADDSLKGNIKSAAFLLNRFGAFVSGELEPTKLSQDDQEILKDYVKRLNQRSKQE
jgi:Family of unknown function (DUF5681)